MARETVVNGRFLTRRVTGVERYGREILSFIGSKCRLEKPARGLHGVKGHIWEQFMLPRQLDPESILWSPANTGPLMVGNQALTIHDLSVLEHPEWFRSSFAAWYRICLPILARHARIVFAPSEYIRQRVMARFGINNVIVTPNGVDRSIFRPGGKQNQQGLPKCYVLFVGSIEPRKNLSTLFLVWDAVKDEFDGTWLVIAGASGHVFKPVHFARQMERVCFLNYVDDSDLAGLYANATLLVLPSFDEGFGLSALEAMASGTPVIVSDGGALPETVGDAALIFNLSRPDTLLTAMRQCLIDRELRSSLKEKGLAHAKSFSWQKTAELIWHTLNEI